MSLKVHSKKVKSKIDKVAEKLDLATDENEHELSYYMNDRVKLMKEVLKIIKPKQIKNMAPDCIKDLNLEEVNSMLLEELLGISNKRLKYIFNGQNLGEDSSSTDPEEEKQPIDIISLDDVSEDDFDVIEVDPTKNQTDQRKHKKRVKQELKTKKIKREKSEKKQPLEEENLMSVLELLELQARARAIRSQLMLEANKKTQSQDENVARVSDNDDDVIIEIPRNEEIVINSSDSENDENKINKVSPENTETQETVVEKTEEKKMTEKQLDTKNVNQLPQDCDDDEIVLIVDQEEMDGMIGD